MKLNLFIIILAIGLLLVGGIFVLNKRSVSLLETNYPNAQNNAVNKEPADTTILVSRKDESSYNLLVSTKAQKILTGISVRLTYPNQGIDFSSQTFIPNPELTANGWVFPVRTIALDNEKNVINLDIAALNATPEGYILASEVNLGTLSNFPLLTFSIDQSQTKIVDKSGEEINYTFNQQ